MRWILPLILSLCLLLGVFLFLADFGPMYTFLYRLTGVEETLPWSAQEIGSVSDHIRDYLFGRRDELFVVVGEELAFEAQEVFHMWEVRHIFLLMRRLLLGLVLVLSIALMRLPVREILRRQLVTTLGLFGILGVAALFFERSFLWMHQTFFDNPYWGFTYDHRLIQLLQENFFLGFLVSVILLTLLLSVLLYALQRRGGRRAHHL